MMGLRTSILLFIVRENVRLAVAIQEFGHHPWPTADGLRQLLQERLERHLGIFLAGQNQKRIDVPLAVSCSALHGFFGHEDHGTVVLRSPSSSVSTGGGKNSP